MHSALRVSLMVAAVIAGLLSGRSINSAGAITEIGAAEARAVYGASCSFDMGSFTGCGGGCSQEDSHEHMSSPMGDKEYKSPQCGGLSCTQHYVDLPDGCNSL
jgi:hypothetical protein